MYPALWQLLNVPNIKSKLINMAQGFKPCRKEDKEMILNDGYWLEGYSAELEEAWAELDYYDEESEEME